MSLISNIAALYAAWHDLDKTLSDKLQKLQHRAGDS